MNLGWGCPMPGTRAPSNPRNFRYTLSQMLLGYYQQNSSYYSLSALQGSSSAYYLYCAYSEGSSPLLNIFQYMLLFFFARLSNYLYTLVNSSRLASSLSSLAIVMPCTSSSLLQARFPIYLSKLAFLYIVMICLEFYLRMVSQMLMALGNCFFLYRQVMILSKMGCCRLLLSCSCSWGGLLARSTPSRHSRYRSIARSNSPCWQCYLALSRFRCTHSSLSSGASAARVYRMRAFLDWKLTWDCNSEKGTWTGLLLSSSLAISTRPCSAYCFNFYISAPRLQYYRVRA